MRYVDSDLYNFLINNTSEFTTGVSQSEYEEPVIFGIYHKKYGNFRVNLNKNTIMTHNNYINILNKQIDYDLIYEFLSKKNSELRYKLLNLYSIVRGTNIVNKAIYYDWSSNIVRFKASVEYNINIPKFTNIESIGLKYLKKTYSPYDNKFIFNNISEGFVISKKYNIKYDEMLRSHQLYVITYNNKTFYLNFKDNQISLVRNRPKGNRHVHGDPIKSLTISFSKEDNLSGTLAGLIHYLLSTNENEPSYKENFRIFLRLYKLFLSNVDKKLDINKKAVYYLDTSCYKNNKYINKSFELKLDGVDKRCLI